MREAKLNAREAEGSRPVAALARFGFCGRGVVYVVIGLLAVQVALGHGGQADQHGALSAIKHTAFGGLLLVLLAISFAGYACWRLLESAVGHRDADGAKRTAKRLASLGRGLLYAGLAVTTTRFLGSSGSQDRTKPLTARAMELPGGRLLVGAVGVGVLVGGLAMAYRGVREKFLKRLDLHSASPTTRKAATWVGRIGLPGRGLVLAVVGGYLVEAAISFDPRKAKGVDAALKSLALAPYGGVLLLAAAVGLFAFGLWSFVEARYRQV